MGLGGMIGGRTHNMDATAQNFISQADSFTQSVTAINSAVEALMQDWFGQSPAAYHNAMLIWKNDIGRVITDLEQLANGLKGSSQSLTQLDQDLAHVFNGFGG
jgi:WXG100 family type VII secretion target